MTISQYTSIISIPPHQELYKLLKSSLESGTILKVIFMTNCLALFMVTPHKVSHTMTFKGNIIMIMNSSIHISHCLEEVMYT